MNRTRAVLIYLLCILAVGCDSGPGRSLLPTEAPVLADGLGDLLDRDDGGGDDDANGPGPTALRGLARWERSPAESDLARAWIGPDGGRLSLGAYEIVVPAGAVSRSTLFKIRVSGDLLKRRFVFAELSPHDVTFNAPVLVRFPLAETSARHNPKARVVRWMGEDDWARFPSVRIEDGARIQAAVTHFSYWGVWADEGELSSGGEAIIEKIKLGTEP